MTEYSAYHARVSYMLIISSDTHVVLLSAELLDPLVVIFKVRNMTRNTVQGTN